MSSGELIEQAESFLTAEEAARITYPGIKGKLLEMLGSGLAPTICATAAGVTESYISQLLSEKEFAEAVTARRFALLQEHNVRDAKADRLEDELLKKLDELLPLMYKPMEVVRAYAIVNAAKRRGTSAGHEASTVINNQVVNLILPPQIVQRFTRDTNNQVVEVASTHSTPQPVQPKQLETRQTLVTMPSSQLLAMNLARRQNKDVENVCHTPSSLPNSSTGEVTEAESTESSTALSSD